MHVARGLLRLGGLIVFAAALSVGIAIAVGTARGSDVRHSAALGLYAGGAILLAVAALSFAGHRNDFLVTGDHGELHRGESRLGLYIVVGLALVGLGVLLESSEPRPEPSPEV